MKKPIVILILIVLVTGLCSGFTVSGQENYDYSKILNGDLSDFVGVWKNANGRTINLKADGTEGFTTVKESDGLTYGQVAEGFNKKADGSYSWGVRFDFCDVYNSSYCIWLFPIGIDIIANGEVVKSDISQVRLYAGHDFSSAEQMRDSIYYFQRAYTFLDVPESHWAFECIEALSEFGILSGYEDGSFKPDAPVTRGEWAKMFVSTFLPIDEHWFSTADLTTNDLYVKDSEYDGFVPGWYSPYLITADPYLGAEHSMEDDGPIILYRPNEGATREDVAVSIAKFLDELGYQTSDNFILPFYDNDTISAKGQKYVADVVNYGIISGFEDNTFKGQDTLTRAEAATILYKTIIFIANNQEG